MRIGDDFFDQPITSLGIRIDDADAEAMAAKVLDGRIQLAADIVNERFTVSHEILQIADLRTVDRRIVDFTQDAAGNREPNMTRSRVGCTNYLLCTPGPSRLYSWCTSRLGKFVDRCHQSRGLRTVRFRPPPHRSPRPADRLQGLLQFLSLGQRNRAVGRDAS